MGIRCVVLLDMHVVHIMLHMRHVLLLNRPASCSLIINPREYLQELLIIDHLLKVRTVQVHEAQQLARLHTPTAHRVKYDVDKVALFQDARALRVALLEPLLQVVNLRLDPAQHRYCLWVLENHLFFQLTRGCSGPTDTFEGVLFVPTEGGSREEVPA